jgi:GNAT superfamily N-acetyltransferase
MFDAPMPYQLRACTAQDRDWAYALKSEAYRAVVERQFGPWDERFQRELFVARWKPTLSKIVIVDGIAVGLVAVEGRSDELCLDEIQIAREWRGRGIGTAILRDLIGQARTGRKPLRLQVLKGNSRAHDLYRRLGFRSVGETKTHHLMENRQAPSESDPSPDPTPAPITPSAGQPAH